MNKEVIKQYNIPDKERPVEYPISVESHTVIRIESYPIKDKNYQEKKIHKKINYYEYIKSGK